MLVGTFTLIVSIFSMLVSGRIADKIGFYRVLIYTISLGMVSGGIAFWLITRDNPTIFNVLGFAFFLTIIAIGSGVCMVPFVARLFNTRERFTVVAISVAIGESVFGGLSPLISTAIEGYMGSVAWVYSCFSFSSFLALVSVIYLGRDLEKKLNFNS